MPALLHSVPFTLKLVARHPIPMADEWKLLEAAPKRRSESALLRYGLAIVLSLFAVFLSLRVPGLMEAPDFMLLGAVVLSAFYGGVRPSLLALALCLVAVICLF